MLPHQIIERVDELIAGYEELKREFPSPKKLLTDLRKIRRLVSEIEKRYGSIERFLDEFQRVRLKLEAVLKDIKKP